MKKWIPIALVVIFAAWILASLASKPEASFQLREFGKLPALLNGRIQPLDSVARNSLLQIRARQTVLGANDQSIPAIEWLAELTMKPETADTRAVFRIDHPDILALLHLDEKTKYFSFNDLRNGLMQIDEQVRRIREIDSQQRNPFEAAVMRLDNAIRIYQRLKYSLPAAGQRRFCEGSGGVPGGDPAGDGGGAEPECERGGEQGADREAGGVRG
ncbi:MAG: hypothetical protein QM796_04740 [Chthoniobacteraceae bacterium]